MKYSKLILFISFISVMQNAQGVSFSERIKKMVQAKQTANRTHESAEVESSEILNTLKEDSSVLSNKLYNKNSANENAISAINSNIEKHKGLKSYTLIDKEEHSNGTNSTVTYQIETKDGTVFKVKLNYLKPFIDDGVKLMHVEMVQ